MSDKYLLDANGEPVRCDDLLEWARAFETTNRLVALDRVGEVGISTVFLGLDYSFGEGLPVLWETMIFGGPHDGYQDRYTSRVEALAGHAKAVELVRSRDDH